MPGDISTFPIRVAIPVQWAEMDAYGHVNNAVYFRYFEIARIKLLERIGFVDTYHELSVGAILRSTSCRFRAPLRYPDTATVGTRVLSVEDDRFTLEYLVLNTSGQTVAEGDSVVVSYDYSSHAKTPLPKAVRIAVDNLSGA